MGECAYRDCTAMGIAIGAAQAAVFLMTNEWRPTLDFRGTLDGQTISIQYPYFRSYLVLTVPRNGDIAKNVFDCITGDRA